MTHNLLDTNVDSDHQGIWALDFASHVASKGALIQLKCIDISNKQFPPNHPPNIEFSVRSVTNLPVEWTNTFSYAHQRLLIVAMNDSRWKEMAAEFFRVLIPGGWAELVEVEAQQLRFGVGPQSTKLVSLINKLYDAKGVIGNLGVYLPSLLAQAGFVNVRCETRYGRVGREIPRDADDEGDEKSEDQHVVVSSQYWASLWGGMKVPVINGGGYGVVQTPEEYDRLLQDCRREWDDSSEALVTYYAVCAQKPM
ncbi:hypothetical protein F5878DRAFT_622246 [Lentinula raphanica]|uniref:S-adenosyl-L-methionine-dependent methyltransferase n=1 Tax=Lentinula raphanica TaxID=153919 RepID=A0AA38P7A9_9AGAR|nr:hypothetical protein F5878DRAFT_622246 [Lentinula raphanica]